MKTFRTHLTELLDPSTVQPFHWIGRSADRWHGDFIFDGRIYRFECVKQATNGDLDSWLYKFSADENPGGTPYASTGDGNQLQVLSTVIAALKDFITKVRPFSVAIIGWKTGFSQTHGKHMKNRRGFLYPKLLDRYKDQIKALGYATIKKDFGRKQYSVLVKLDYQDDYERLAGQLDLEY